MTTPSAFSNSLPGTAPARRQYPPSPPPFDPATVGGRDPIEHAARVQRGAADGYDAPVSQHHLERRHGAHGTAGAL